MSADDILGRLAILLARDEAGLPRRPEDAELGELLDRTYARTAALMEAFSPAKQAEYRAERERFLRDPLYVPTDWTA